MAVAEAAVGTFFVTGGTLPPAAPSYIERQADRDLYEFMRKGEFSYVLNARQMGKSSLSVRTMARLTEDGARTVFVDLTKLGGRNVTPDQWYAGLLAEIGRSLGLRQEFVKHFVEHKDLGPMQRFFGALREVALERIPEPICIFIDEVDATRALSFSADEFFAGIRECYNRRVLDPEYRRLTFCLLGVAAPSDLIQDVRTTPFNIGKNITLRDFTLEEARQLLPGLGRDAERKLERVLYWTHGHPYLTQTLCAAIAEKGIESSGQVDKLVHDTFFEKKARMGHVNLADVSNRVLNGFQSADQIDSYRAEILQLYAKVRSRWHKVADDSGNHLMTILRLSGIARVDNGRLVPRNRIYETVFDEEWIEENMPGKERRRQKRAFRLGVARAASVAGVIVAAMAALAGYSAFMAAKASESNNRANYELYVAQVGLMETAWDENNIDRLRELLEDTKDHPARGWEWQFWQRLSHLEELAIDDKEPGYGPAFSPDGAEIVMRYPSKLSFYDSKSGKELRSFVMPRPSLGFAIWSPDGKTVLDPATDEGLFIYDAETGEQKVGIPARQHSVSLRPFSPDGKLLVSSPSHAEGRSELTIWQTSNGAFAHRIHRPDITIQGGTFTPSGKVIALYLPHDIGSFGAFLYDLDKREVVRDYPTTQLPFCSIVSPDGKYVAVGQANGWIQVFDIETGAVTSEVRAHHGTVAQMDLTRDGRFLASVASDRLCKIWTFAQGRITEINSLRGAGLVNFAPDGKRVLAGFFDIRVFNPFERDESTDKALPLGLPGQILIDPTGKFGFFQTDDLVLLIDPVTLESSPLPNELSTNGFVSDDARYLLVAGEGNTWQLVRTGEWEPLMTLRALKSAPSEIRVSQNGKRLAILSVDRTITVYEVPSGQRVGPFLENESFTAADLSPDGRKLITGNLWGQVKLWDVESGKVIGNPKAHRRTVFSATFADNGKLALTAADDDTARVWDVSTGEQKLLLTGHSNTIFDARFSPDMRRILTASRDLTARLWDADTGRQVLVLDGHQGEVLSAQFTPDGKKIVTSCADGLARMWTSEPHRHTDLGVDQKAPE